jgi:uncharacterized protein YciI
MKHFALIYDVVENFADRRLPVREVHLVHLHEAHASGLLQFSGPLGDPPDGALLILRADSAAQVEAFARADPYVIHGLVTAWRVRPWNILIAPEPAGPPPAL